MSVYRALGLPGNTPVTCEFRPVTATAPDCAVLPDSARDCPV
jgi:hypothetical protein